MKKINNILFIELGQLIEGPFCGQLIAAFGAVVIKVELPTGGDAMRQWAAPVGTAIQSDGT